MKGNKKYTVMGLIKLNLILLIVLLLSISAFSQINFNLGKNLRVSDLYDSCSQELIVDTTQLIAMVLNTEIRHFLIKVEGEKNRYGRDSFIVKKINPFEKKDIASVIFNRGDKNFNEYGSLSEQIFKKAQFSGVVKPYSDKGKRWCYYFDDNDCKINNPLLGNDFWFDIEDEKCMDFYNIAQEIVCREYTTNYFYFLRPELCTDKKQISFMKRNNAIIKDDYAHWML